MEKKNGKKKLLNVSKASTRMLLLCGDKFITHTCADMVLKPEEALNTHWIGYTNMHAPDPMDLVNNLSMPTNFNYW